MSRSPEELEAEIAALKATAEEDKAQAVAAAVFAQARHLRDFYIKQHAEALAHLAAFRADHTATIRREAYVEAKEADLKTKERWLQAAVVDARESLEDSLTQVREVEQRMKTETKPGQPE